MTIFTNLFQKLDITFQKLNIFRCGFLQCFNDTISNNGANFKQNPFFTYVRVVTHCVFIGPRHFWEVEVTSYRSPRDSKRVKAEGVRLRQEIEGIAKVCHPARSRPTE